MVEEQARSGVASVYSIFVFLIMRSFESLVFVDCWALWSWLSYRVVDRVDMDLLLAQHVTV